jgi:hypothetical protein
MDDLLIDRWRAGETNATTAVRNAIRSVAERVLSHRALHTCLGPQARARLRNNEQRREVTAGIAAEIMRKPGQNANQVKAAAMMAACRVAVEGMQEGRAPAEDAHLPPPLAVTFALAPASVHPRMREAAERHLGHCGPCREDIRVVDSIVRSWDAADTDATRDDLAEAVEEDAFPLPPGMNLADLMRDALEEQDRVDRGVPASTPARSAGATAPARGSATPSRTGARAATGPAPAPTGGAAKGIAAVVLLGLIGAGAFFFTRGGGAPEVRAPAGALRPIADRSPPTLGDTTGLPGEINQIQQDLANKDCRTAAGRARQLGAANPQAPRLALIEAGAFVCAGDGGKALQALDRMGDPGPLRAEADWTRAQALLLEGQGGPAVSALQRVMTGDPALAARASAQLAKVEALGG